MSVAPSDQVLSEIILRLEKFVLRSFECANLHVLGLCVHKLSVSGRIVCP